VHFVLLTVYADKGLLYRSFDAGVDDFLAKPFNEFEMIARYRAGMRAVAMYDELSLQHQGSRKLNQQLISVNHTLEKLAVTDDLTGLANRRQAVHRLEELWSMADRYPRPLAVISIDIDRFKNVNDEYGHSAGDIVLLGVSDCLRECVRTTDTVCRIGGEEFLLILPSQTMQEAEICAQRCRQAVMQREFISGGHVIHATISEGIASRRLDMPSCADLLKEADDALYTAKRAGRNTVCCTRVQGTAELATINAA
jgi:diguanylate cyclase (GGDEF)-like protein